MDGGNNERKKHETAEKLMIRNDDGGGGSLACPLTFMNRIKNANDTSAVKQSTMAWMTP